MPTQKARQHPKQISRVDHCTKQKWAYQVETLTIRVGSSSKSGILAFARIPLRKFRQEHPGMPLMLVKLRPKLLRQKFLFPPRLDIERHPDNGHRDQSSNLPIHDRTPQKPAQNSCIDWMPDIPIRPRSNQLVSFLQRHDPAPVRPQMHARPDRDRQSQNHDRDADPLDFPRVRHEVDPHKPEIGARVIEQKNSDKYRRDVRQPLHDRLTLLSLLPLPRRHEPIQSEQNPQIVDRFKWSNLQPQPQTMQEQID